MWTSQTSRPFLRHAFGIDVDHDALAAEPPGGLTYEIRVAAGGRIDRDLVRARIQQRPDVLDRANPAADGQRHEHLLRRPPHDVDHDVAILVAGRDVQEHQFVGPLLLVPRGDFHGIAGVPQVQEIGSLHHPAAVDIQTGNNAFCQHLGDETHFRDRAATCFDRLTWRTVGVSPPVPSMPAGQPGENRWANAHRSPSAEAIPPKCDSRTTLVA